MLEIKPISEQEFSSFVSKHPLNSFYESLDWYHLKLKENKRCELLGLYDSDVLVGASLIIYVRILRKFYYAYASRGFVYDYSNIRDFKDTIYSYFKIKKVAFFRMDPPIVLNEYFKKMEKVSHDDSNKLIEDLKANGFIHYGYNQGFETMQFRFIHALKCSKTYEEQLAEMNKSTRKNIELAERYGVKIKEVGSDYLGEVVRLFDKTVNRKKIDGFGKAYYERLLDVFGDNIIMYIAYVDKESLKINMENQLSELHKEMDDLTKQMQKSNVGAKLLKKKEIIENSINKCNEMLKYADKMQDTVNIASMLCIKEYDEIVSYVSGMDNEYRLFCPKYALYPAMIKYAIDNKLKTVNFLGVKNIFNKNDKDYGILDVKRGFGGSTIEFIGEFDLPINSFIYKIYKIKENHERKS